MSVPHEIDVTTAAAMRQQGARLLDVREASELAVCQLPGCLHVPMGEIPARLTEFPADTPLLVLCHHGGRSARVTQFLRANGFDQAINVAGGIDAWARQIDPGLARY
ncbi:MAG: rhodanese-like domain-containing protein [Candidatus Didemnitutus sp.]|nr:rhodanese-like domain-containing protein [Candidatus Didemnitutus sp.]